MSAVRVEAAERTVPFLDLRPQHEEVREAIEEVFARILDTSSFVGGEHVERFEAAFAAFVGSARAVGVGSGTDAVRIALQAVGVEPGDAVITVSHTFIATAEGVTQIGAMPLFVDVEDGPGTMDPGEVERLLREECRREAGGTVVHRATGRRVSALLPVHLYGQSADMAPLLELAREYGLRLVEDAAQAHGATYTFPDGTTRSCGSMGDAAAFSFYPGKNLGAIGEAGAIVTDSEEVARRAQILRDHGQVEKYVHVRADGGNARLDALQAAVLELKLGRLGDWNEARRRVAAQYDRRLNGSAVGTPVERPYARHVYHLYVVRVADRQGLQRSLREAGVATGLHYPIPVHRQEAYRGTATADGSLPRTERAAGEVLSLPMYPHLDPDAVDYVADQVLRLSS